MQIFSANISRSFSIIGLSLAVLVAGFAYSGRLSCLQAYEGACPTPTPSALFSQELAPHYYEYSDQAFQDALSRGKVVLYFWAPWCSTCTSLDSDLQEKKASVPEGLTVFRINYDQASELKRKYNVVTQHTFVQVDPAGEAVATWVGGDMSDFTSHLH